MPTQKIERTELLHRCWEVLHRQGFHHTSINDLAQAGGLGKAGLLHHFGSKEGLMQAVLPAQFFYRCQFVSVLRKSPQPPRAAQAFAQCLVQVHG